MKQSTHGTYYRYSIQSFTLFLETNGIGAEYVQKIKLFTRIIKRYF